MRGVLVDSSVWIRGLAGLEAFAKAFGELLSGRQVLGHPLVYGELLIGDVGGGRQRVLSRYRLMSYARAAEHDAVVDMVLSHRLSGRGLSWIDVHLLASALLEGVPLWTADRALNDAAAAVGIAYVP